MVAKVGLGIIGLSAISVGGVALAKPHLLGMDYMPEWHSLSEDNGYGDSVYGTGKFGKKYGKYLVGVTNKTGTGEEAKKENKAWWEWAYRRFQANKPTTDSKFKSVDRPYDVSNAQALNKVCDEAYKKGDSDFQTTASSAHFTKEEVWKYCSIGGAQPQTIKEFNMKKPSTETEEKYSNSEDNAIAKEDNEKGKLLSIKSPVNDWIWDLKDKEFRSTTISENGYFKTEKDKDVAERKTLKEICKGAYGQSPVSTTGNNKLEKTDATKYCSLEQITA